MEDRDNEGIRLRQQLGLFQTLRNEGINKRNEKMQNQGYVDIIRTPTVLEYYL